MNESNDGQSLSSADYNNSDTFLTGSHENNEPSLMERTAATGTNTSSDEICTTTLVTNADHDDSMDESNHLDTTGTNTSSDEIGTTTLVTNADHDDSMDEINHLDKVSIPHFFSNTEKEQSETMNIQYVDEQHTTLKLISRTYMSRNWVTDCLRMEPENLFRKNC